jgi:hypothetical protein
VVVCGWGAGHGEAHADKGGRQLSERQAAVTLRGKHAMLAGGVESHADSADRQLSQQDYDRDDGTQEASMGGGVGGLQHWRIACTCQNLCHMPCCAVTHTPCWLCCPVVCCAGCVAAGGSLAVEC